MKYIMTKSVSRRREEYFVYKCWCLVFMHSQKQKDQHLLNITLGLSSTSSFQNGGGIPYLWRKGGCPPPF